jgi:hypothetical protein
VISVSLCTLSIALGFLFQPASARLEDACDGAGVRPVVLVPGYMSSPLFNSQDNYTDWLPSRDGTDLSTLPLQWDGLEQAQGPLVPENSAEDVSPDLSGFVGEIIAGLVRIPHLLHLLKTCLLFKGYLPFLSPE